MDTSHRYLETCTHSQEPQHLFQEICCNLHLATRITMTSAQQAASAEVFGLKSLRKEKISTNFLN